MLCIPERMQGGCSIPSAIVCVPIPSMGHVCLGDGYHRVGKSLLPQCTLCSVRNTHPFLDKVATPAAQS